MEFSDKLVIGVALSFSSFLIVACGIIGSCLRILLSRSPTSRGKIGRRQRGGFRDLAPRWFLNLVAAAFGWCRAYRQHCKTDAVISEAALTWRQPTGPIEAPLEVK